MDAKQKAIEVDKRIEEKKLNSKSHLASVAEEKQSDLETSGYKPDGSFKQVMKRIQIEGG